MKTFEEWLKINHPESLDEGLGKWVLGPALAAATVLNPVQPPPMPETPEQQRVVNLKQHVIDYIQNNYKIKIRPDQIRMMKPSEALGPQYGKDWEMVKSRAKKAQDSGIPYSSATNVDKLETPIPIVLEDPRIFKGQEDSQGFCLSGIIDGKFQKFCVIKDLKDLNIIRHELRHTAQGQLFSDDPMDKKEIAVRLAEMKLNYFQLTGKHVTKATFFDMIDHCMENQEKYSYDVRQLLGMMDSWRGEEFEKMMKFMMSILDQLVKNDPPKSDEYA